MPDAKKPVILLILDGWGIAPVGPGNAITLANTINYDRLWASYPHTQLKASGDAVGLPRGEAGNSETGHLNIGAGKIVYQDLERINMAIADGSFFEISVFNEAVEHAKKNKSNLHLIGLIGAGGVHSNIEHLMALIGLARKQKFSGLFVHAITDGRDSPPNASLTYLNTVNDELKKDNIGSISTVIGRYWAMDRDRRWDRTAKAYFALTKGQGHLVKSFEEAIKNSYGEGKTDEFIEPSVITNEQGIPRSVIKDNDSVIFFNFRIDRPRQLTAAFMIKEFDNKSMSLDFDPYLEKYEKTHYPKKVENYQKVFERGEMLKNLFFVTMTEYSKSITKSGVKVAFSPGVVEMPLGKIISDNGMTQLKLAESEKERFVTYYFNGQQEIAFKGEERIIVPSPNVPTYDQMPEMSVYKVTETLLEKLKSGSNYGFVFVNFANPDMVGHTGNIGPAVKACEAVDECLGKISNFILAYGGTLLVTADHGNVEEMINLRTGQIDTEHSTNLVPFIAVGKQYLGKYQNLQSGILADLAPTVLDILNIPVPHSMTGRNLLQGII